MQLNKCGADLIHSFKNYWFERERGVLVAWNGGTCDLEWIYRLTKAPGSTLSFPKRIKYFLDPYRAVKNTTGCRLNKKYSGLSSYSLGSVYEKIVGLQLLITIYYR